MNDSPEKNSPIESEKNPKISNESTIDKALADLRNEATKIQDAELKAKDLKGQLATLNTKDKGNMLNDMWKGMEYLLKGVSDISIKIKEFVTQDNIQVEFIGVGKLKTSLAKVVSGIMDFYETLVFPPKAIIEALKVLYQQVDKLTDGAISKAGNKAIYDILKQSNLGFSPENGQAAPNQMK